MTKEFIDKAKTFVVSLILLTYSHQLIAQTPRPVPDAYPSGTLVNFVRTWNATAPEQDPNLLMTRPLRDVKLATQYLDGLGRPLQTVIKKGSLATDPSNPNSSTDAKDLISPVEYDEFGREQFKYLPFAANTTGGYPTNDGKFRMNPFQQQETFMTAQYGSQNETFFYSKTNFEASPLNRATDSYAPGDSWVGSEINVEVQRRNVQVKYFINTLTDAVRIWTVSDNNPIGQFETYATTAAYPAGELYKNITIDENKKQVIEFKDKGGKVILKKVQLIAAADDGTGSGHIDWLCTYYIYDDLGNLRCVIQPEGVKAILPTWVLTTPLLTEQCFRYEYDQRNRMIMKKAPGAGEVYMVYDGRDRLVMSQDANMRQETKWMVTKYDVLNRPTETGLWNNSIVSFETHLSTAYTYTTEYPATTSGYEMLTLSHYDDYIGLPGGLSATYITTWNGNFSATSNNWPYPQMPTQSNALKGMATWSQVKVLGTTNTYLYTVIIYDDKGRPIQAQSTNITGGTDVMTTQYSWAGQPLVTVQKQDKQGSPAQSHIVITKMNYDDLGRLLNIKKSVNSTINTSPPITVNKPELEIVNNQYDELGQLVLKNIGKKKIPGTEDYTNDPIETLALDYNIRGWMLGVNRLYAKDLANNYFGFDLGYDKANNNIIGGQTYANPQYNGNIEGMVWKSKGDGEKRKYDFGYDAANRLMKADFTQYTGGTFNQNALVNYNIRMGDASGTNVASAYDDNGNILRMQQWGWKLTGSIQVDDLSYNYQAGSNRLSKVTDGITTDNKLGDFKDGSNGVSDDYGYDDNGNLNTDFNKNIVANIAGNGIRYNHLNLPVFINVEVKGGITYTYDATGNKIKKEVYENPTTANGNKAISTVTNYINGFVYESKTIVPADANSPDYTDKLLFLGQEEGRIRFKPSAPGIAASFEYDYMLKDHLGNVRMVLTEEQQQDRYPAATLENITHNGGQAVNIESQYYSIDNSKIVLQSVATGIPTYQNNNNISNPNPYSNTGANSASLYLLNATTNTVQNKNGLGIVLRVMAGDAINIWGKSYHKMPTGPGYSSSTNPLSVLDLMNLLAASPTASPKGITGTQISGLPGFPTNVTSLLGNPPPQANDRPRASINWVILDEQFKYVSGGFDMVETAINTNGTFKDHTIPGIAIPKNGYIYVYCSNESQYNVFFDNLQIVHDRGPILEETHYYPFGLTMAGISSKAASALTTSAKFNGIEHSNDFDLNLYDAFYRTLDPQIGRWWQLDPKCELFYSHSLYSGMGNNPILLSDPLGDSIPTKIFGPTGTQVYTIPSEVQQMYNTEYGITVGYDAAKELMYKTGEVKTDKKVSASAKAMWDQELGDCMSANSLVFGYGLKIIDVVSTTGNTQATVVPGGFTRGKTSYIDLYDFGPGGILFGNLPEGIPSRAANMARIVEHEYLGHNVSNQRDFPYGVNISAGTYNPGAPEMLVNKFRREMSLPMQLDYTGILPNKPATNYIRYGNSYNLSNPPTGKLHLFQSPGLNKVIKTIIFR